MLRSLVWLLFPNLIFGEIEELVESVIQELQMVGTSVEKFRELFLAGHDVYASYGSIVFDKSPAELTDEDRRRTKILLFPKLHGGSR